jgi:iron(III) transport system permease protein
MSSPARILDIGTLLIAIPVALPLIVVLAALFGPADEVWLHLREYLLTEYILNTLLLMLLTGMLAGVFGISTAWLNTHYEFAGHRWVAPALILPLALPTYVAGYVYADLLEVSGPVQSFIRDISGWGVSDFRLPPIRSLPGAALVMSVVLYPYVYLLVRVNLDAQSSILADASRTLGASNFELFRRVTLPLARPAIAGGLALVLMETAAEFGVVEHFGVATLTTGVFRTWLAMGERSAALQLAAWLFLLVIFLVALEQATRKGQRFNLATPDKPARKQQLRGIASALALIVCLLPIFLGFILPAGLLLNYAVDSGDQLLGTRFIEFIKNSLFVSTIAAGLCVIGAMWLAYAARLRRNVTVRYGIRVATLGYAIPGLVLATGALLPLTTIDQWLATQFDGINSLVITGTVAGLVFVYIARFMTVAFNSVQGGLGQIHPALDAAARTLGASPTRLFGRVHLPLLTSTIAYAGLLSFIDVIKELPATLIMRPFNFETLATRVYRLAADERLPEASTAALFILALSLIPTLLLARRK